MALQSRSFLAKAAEASDRSHDFFGGFLVCHIVLPYSFGILTESRNEKRRVNSPFGLLLAFSRSGTYCLRLDSASFAGLLSMVVHSIDLLLDWKTLFHTPSNRIANLFLAFSAGQFGFDAWFPEALVPLVVPQD